MTVRVTDRNLSTGDVRTFEYNTAVFAYFVFVKKHHVHARVDYDNAWLETFLYTVSVSDLKAVASDDALTGCAITATGRYGETVTPRSDRFRFEPSSTSTVPSIWPSESDTGIAQFKIVSETSAFGAAGKGEGGSSLTGTIEADVGELKPHRPRTATIYYAAVTGVSGDVTAKGPLGGDFVQVQLCDHLAPGTVVRLRNSSGPDGIVKPCFSVQFCERTSASVRILGEYTELQGGLYVKLGASGIEGTGPCDLVSDAENLVYDVAYNQREYAQWTIRKGLGAGVAWAAGAWGWLLSKAAGKTAEYVVRKASGDGGSRLPGGPALGQGGCDATLDFQATLKGDGRLVIENKGVPLDISDAEGTLSGGIAGTRTCVAVDGYVSGSVSFPVALPPAPGATPVPLEIRSPADGGSIATAFPLVELWHYGSEVNLAVPSTLSCRLNGILVSDLFPETNIPLAQTKWQVPFSLALARGPNRIAAAVTDENGFRTRATSTFDAVVAPPVPGNLSVHPGRRRIVLRWKTDSRAGVAGFRVYRAVAPSGDWQLLDPGIFLHPVCADTTINTQLQYLYSVSAVDRAGYEGDRCTAVVAAADMSLAPAVVPAVSGFRLAAGDAVVTESFDSGSPGTLAWKLERSVSPDGPFEDVLPAGRFLAESGFADTSVENGRTYYYRLTPLGYDLAEGPASTAGPVTPLDTAPSPPSGVTAEVSGRTVLVEWNPSSEADLDGYNVYGAGF